MLASSAEVLPVWFSMLEFIELMATLYVRTLALIGAGNGIVWCKRVKSRLKNAGGAFMVPSLIWIESIMRTLATVHVNGRHHSRGWSRPFARMLGSGK